MAATLAWNPDSRARWRLRIGGDRSGAARARPSDRALALEPPPDEMPAIDGPLDLMEPETAPPRKRAKKKTKAEAAAQRDEQIAAAIDAAASSAESPLDDELPSPDLLTPPPERNWETAASANSTRWAEAHGGAAHVQGGRRAGGPHDGTGRDAVRDRAGAGREGAPVRESGQRPRARHARARASASWRRSRGKGAVGVEVPNPRAEIVAFRELIESRDFQNARAALPIALGKDLEGQPVDRRPRQDAAPAHRGRDRLRQVRVREHDHHEPDLPAHAARRCAS